MHILGYRSIITLGVAIFSMFFGAGNVIFPLALGVDSAQHFTISFVGLIITSIGVPLLGLYGALLYEGNLRQFFSPLGNKLCLFMIFFLIIALGPLGAMSRCLTLTYSALNPLFPHLKFPLFSFLSAVMIVIVIYKRKYLLPILGKMLSPVLLCMLIAITILGVLNNEPIMYSSLTASNSFVHGFYEGYKTMDLLAAILFSITIWRLVKDKLNIANKVNISIYKTCLLASFVAGTLLAMIYLGLGLAAKANISLLTEIRHDHMLGILSFNLLGPKWGMIANITVALACFTTIVSLAVAAVDALWQTFNSTSWVKENENVFYTAGIIFMTVSTTIFANIGFENLSKVIAPIVNICYPAIITLTICNILHKKVGIQSIKIPTFSVLGITVLSKLFL